MSIPAEVFQHILDELTRRPLAVNKYRNVAGSGKSQAFGVVNRRCLPPDYSRQCWVRPALYKLLLDFAEKYVSIPYTSITVNQDYQASAHRDKGNKGLSFLVAFGDYTGGECEMLEGDQKGLHDVKNKPLVADFGKNLHQVKPFQGTRISLVYYTLDAELDLPPASVVSQGTKWLFKRGEDICKGLPHPLKGRSIRKEEKPVVVEFL